MALRNVKINLIDSSYEGYQHVTPMFVLTKKNNGEIKSIVEDILNKVRNDEIPFFTAQEDIIKILSEDVSESSHKTMSFDISVNGE